MALSQVSRPSVCYWDGNTLAVTWMNFASLSGFAHEETCLVYRVTVLVIRVLALYTCIARAITTAGFYPWCRFGCVPGPGSWQRLLLPLLVSFERGT